MLSSPPAADTTAKLSGPEEHVTPTSTLALIERLATIR
jgi:hypothetical protein